MLYTSSSESESEYSTRTPSLVSLVNLVGPVNKPKSRKRNRNPDQHKQNIAKRCRNSGKQYVTKKGKVCEGKVFSNIPCNCRMKCNNKISSDERKSMFESFWNMAEFGKQNSYICGLVQRNEVKRRRPRKEGSSQRKGSNKCYLKTTEGLLIQVCQSFFLKTFQLSEGRVNRALCKLVDGKLLGIFEVLKAVFLEKY